MGTLQVLTVGDAAPVYMEQGGRSGQRRYMSRSSTCSPKITSPPARAIDRIWPSTAGVLRDRQRRRGELPLRAGSARGAASRHAGPGEFRITWTPGSMITDLWTLLCGGGGHGAPGRLGGLDRDVRRRWARRAPSPWRTRMATGGTAPRSPCSAARTPSAPVAPRRSNSSPRSSRGRRVLDQECTFTLTCSSFTVGPHEGAWMTRGPCAAEVGDTCTLSLADVRRRVERRRDLRVRQHPPSRTGSPRRTSR